MKKCRLLICALLMCAVLAMLPMEAEAMTIASGMCGANLTWVLTDDGVLTISGTGAMWDYDEYVYSPTAPWGDYCYDITKVVIGDNVTGIGKYAFYSCEEMTSVEIGNSVTSIGDNAFEGCESLTSVEFPTDLMTIGETAFAFCDSLKQVKIGGKVAHIEPWTFYWCESLTSVEIGDSVTTIGDEAFYHCDALTSVVIGDGVTTIGDSAFEACYALENLVVGNSVTTILDKAFYDCDGLTSLVLPASLTTVDWHAFAECSGLKTVVIKGGMLGLSMFYNCESLTNVLLCDGVTIIENHAFRYCSALTTVTIPDSVTSIGDNAFYGCNSLITVNYTGSEKQWNLIKIGEGNDNLLRLNIVFNYEPTLDAPNLTVSNVASSGKIQLSWNEIDGADKYEIWHSTVENGAYTKLGSTSKTTYINSSVETGETYYYKVRAIAGDTNGAFSSIKGGTCDLPRPRVTVENDPVTGKPVINWGKIDGADAYEVYRSSEKDGTYTKIGTTSGLKTTDNSIGAGETGYYKVVAVYGANGSANSAFSVAVGRTCDLARPEATANNSASTGKIVLTWDAVTGADRYEVWRSTSKNGTYSKILTTTDLKMIHSSAKAGETFYYKVKAICDANASGNSAFSDAVGRTCDLAQPKATVTNNESTGKIVLTWNAVTGADRYEVWRSTSKNGTYTKVLTTTGLKMTHSSAKGGETFYYKVKAICDANASGNSVFSAAVGRTCDLAQPKLTVTNNESNGKIVLTWKAVSGADRYEIWRSTTKDGTYTKLTTTTGLKITNSSINAGETYYYKIRAICDDNASGNSAFSAAVGRTCDCAQVVVTITKNSKGKPVITWKAVSGAVKYEVWRSTSENGTYTRLVTTTGLKITNSSAEDGVTYYYKVRAICKVSAGNGAYSAVQSVTVG